MTAGKKNLIFILCCSSQLRGVGFVCSRSKCHFVTSRGQHDLKVKWFLRQQNGRCHQGPSPCQCLLRMVFNNHSLNVSSVRLTECFVLFVVLVSALTLWLRHALILQTFPNPAFRCCGSSGCFPSSSPPFYRCSWHVPHMHVSFLFTRSPACRLSWLRASLSVQVVMTTVSAALNTTLKVWRSSHSAAHLDRFNVTVILQKISGKQTKRIWVKVAAGFIPVKVNFLLILNDVRLFWLLWWGWKPQRMQFCMFCVSTMSKRCSVALYSSFDEMLLYCLAFSLFAGSDFVPLHHSVMC